MLSIVATPIGNMDDMSFRAIKTLQSADLVAAEDTRRTGKLLKHFGIQARMTAFHDRNKRTKTKHIIALLKEGKHVCVVSDAGTPGISDPGFVLVREAVKENIPITPIPGPNAAISCLVASGLPTDSFTFIGFMPKTKGKREKVIASLEHAQHTTIAYESPHRIMRTLEEFARLLPNREICLGRELTKKFEEFLRGTPSEIMAAVQKKKALGEITLVIRSG